MNTRHQIRAVLAGVLAVSSLGFGSARAAPLAPAVVAGQVAFANPPAGIQVSTFGTFPLSGPNGVLQFTASGAPVPLLTADATMAPFFFGSGSGTLEYQMEVVGPVGDVPVSITVTGGVSGSSQVSSGDSFAGFAMTISSRFETISGTPLIPEQGFGTGTQTGAFSQGLGATHDLMLTANQVYKVTMLVNVGARAASATAFIDPVFTFGPDVGPEYSFNFSDGIGNAPIPEPETYVLLSAGLLGMLALSRGQIRRNGAG